VPQVFSYRKAQKYEIIFDHPTDISVDGEIERIKDKMVLTILKNAITLSAPKSCQPIAIEPAVIKAAKKYNAKG
jgi:diacylglycerol kinase family enzyme